MKNILFTNGISDKGTVEVIEYKNGLTFNSGGSCDICNHITLPTCNSKSVIFDMNKSSNINVPQNLDLIFNEISEPDLYLNAMSKVVALAEQLRIPVINHPRYVLNTRRNKVYELLKNAQGIIIPKTIRYNSTKHSLLKDAVISNTLSLPLILREVGIHGGESTVLLSNNDDIEQCTHFALKEKTYYLTEFYDYKNNNDLYVKTRIVVIGNDFYIRHAIASTHWEVHASKRVKEYEWVEKTALKAFEHNIKPKITHAINTIKKAMGLAYFGIDCCIDEHFNLIIFEVNANMNVLKLNGDYTDPYTTKINKAITSLIEEYPLNA